MRTNARSTALTPLRCSPPARRAHAEEEEKEEAKDDESPAEEAKEDAPEEEEEEDEPEDVRPHPSPPPCALLLNRPRLAAPARVDGLPGASLAWCRSGARRLATEGPLDGSTTARADDHSCCCCSFRPCPTRRSRSLASSPLPGPLPSSFPLSDHRSRFSRPSARSARRRPSARRQRLTLSTARRRSAPARAGTTRTASTSSGTYVPPTLYSLPFILPCWLAVRACADYPFVLAPPLAAHALRRRASLAPPRPLLALADPHILLPARLTGLRRPQALQEARLNPALLCSSGRPGQVIGGEGETGGVDRGRRSQAVSGKRKTPRAGLRPSLMDGGSGCR